MAIIDVVNYRGGEQDFVWRFPSQDLRLGSKLVVNTDQVAFFVSGGKIHDQFGPGTYTLSTDNIPVLGKVLNLVYGGNSPFQAEVWFVNLVSKLDNKWGTPEPIQLEDPKYKVIVHLRAFGQFGLKIADPRLFLEKLVGTLTVFTTDKILAYFIGNIISSVTTLISQKLIKDNVSVLEIPGELEALSGFCGAKIADEFTKYGIDILNFYFISINTPANDPGMLAIEKAKEKAMYINTVGRDVYSYDNSMDVMQKAAGNPGTAGGMMGAGLGMGMGVGLGHQMGNMSNQLNTNLDQHQNNLTPPPPPLVQYHVLINNVQQGPLDLSVVQDLITKNTLQKETYVWKPGMANWEKAGSVSELQNFFMLVPPPPPIS